MKTKFKIIFAIFFTYIFLVIAMGSTNNTDWNKDENSSNIVYETSEEEQTAEDDDEPKKDDISKSTKPKINLPIEHFEDNKEESDEEKEDSNLVSLGTFRLTAYCNCSICCGKWAGGATASGTMPMANRTIAVDTGVISFGTKVIINGNTYIAEDTGSAIYGNRIDIYFNNHEEASRFGVQYAEVFIAKK